MLELSRRNLLAGTGAVGLGATAQALIVPTAAQASSLQYNQTAPRTPTLAHEGEVLHDARFAQHGFSRYKNLHPTDLVIGRDLGIAKDPAGSLEPVAWFDSKIGLSHGNTHKRASVESAARAYSTAHWNKRAIYAHRISFYLPSQYAMSTTSHWTSIGGVHGAPWIGPSRNGLMIVFNPKTKQHYLRMGDDKALLKEADTVVPLNRWVDVLVYFNYNYASQGGWIRFFMNTSGNRDRGWRSVSVSGTRGAFKTDLISSREGNAWHHDKTKAAATPRVGVYGNHAVKMYVREHLFTTTVRSALGATWDGLIDGRTFSD